MSEDTISKCWEEIEWIRSHIRILTRQKEWQDISSAALQSEIDRQNIVLNRLVEEMRKLKSEC